MSTFNVMADFGAWNDAHRDDTAAIDAAINAANSAGGGTVYFPANLTSLANGYRTTATLASPGNGVALEGDGWKSSVIRPDGNFDALYINGAEQVGIHRLGVQPLVNQSAGIGLMIHNGASIIVDQFKVYADGANRPFHGIKVDGGGTYKVWVSRSEVDACNASGIDIGTYGVVEFPQGIYFRESIVGACLGDGVNIFSGGGNLMIDCEVLANVGHGIVIVPGPGQNANLLVDSCGIDTNGGHGVVVNTIGSGSASLDMLDTWVGNNGNLPGHITPSDGISIYPNANVRSVAVRGCHIAVNGGNGMALKADEEMIVRDNRVRTNGIQTPNASTGIYVHPCGANIMVANNFANGAAMPPYVQQCGYGIYINLCPNFKSLHGNVSIGHTVADWTNASSPQVNTANV